LYQELQEDLIQLLSIPPVKFNQGSIKVTHKQLIFPNGSPQPSLEPQSPEFYTQMQTGSKGDGTFIHCLVVWEYVNPIISEESKPNAYSQRISLMTDILDASPAEHKQSDSSDPTRSDQPGVYVPVAMCIETHQVFFRASKELMVALYNHYHDTCEAMADSDMVHLIANTEFARHVSFILNDLFIPPPECKFEVQIGQYRITHTADELDRLPHSEDCIKVLFEVLDISNIILLWKSLLLEKHVVILSSSKYMCFNVCEGIKALMFPLQWAFNYTPILPSNMVEFLEVIFPTIFGVLNTVVSFEEVKKLSPNATIIDVDTQRSSSDSFELFCPRIEDQLRLKLQSLKLSAYSRLDKANVKRIYHKTKEFEVSAGTDTELITQIRQAFLQVFIDAFSTLDSCFTFNEAKNEHEVNPENFLNMLPECPYDHGCKDFWKSLIESEHFIQYCLAKYNLVNSYAKIFDRMTKAQQQTKKDSPTYTLTSCLHPKAMYNTIWQALKSANSEFKTGEIDKTLRILRQSADIFFRDNQEDINNHPYFEDSDFLSHLKSSPRPKARTHTVPTRGHFGEAAMKVTSISESHFFYGNTGLYKYLRTLFGFMGEQDFKKLSDNEVLLQSLEDAPQTWQTHLVRASAYLVQDSNGEQVIEEFLRVSELYGDAVPINLLNGVLPRLRMKTINSLKTRQDLIGTVVRGYIESKRIELAEGDDSEEDDKFNESITELPSAQSRRTRRFKTYMLPGQEAGALFSYKVKLLNDRPWSGSFQDALSVSVSLLQQLLNILHRVDFNLEGLSSHADFQHLSMEMSALQQAVLGRAESRLETICVYMNLYNLCLLHSLIEKNSRPKNRYEWNTQIRKSFYIINSSQCSVYELIDAVLNLGTNESPESDSYPYGKLELSEPLATFGYFLPVNFAPTLRVYTNPSTVLDELRENATTLLDMPWVSSSDRVIRLPALIKYSGRVFGDSDGSRLQALQHSIDRSPWSSHLSEAIRCNYSVEYNEPDWSFSFEACSS
jgi:hypothetical protein